MNKSTLYDWQWHVRQSLKKLGFWGMFAIFLTLVSAYFYTRGVAELKAEVASLQAETLRIHQDNNDRQQQQMVEKNQQQDATVAALYQSFLTVDALPAVLGNLYQHAKQQQITLQTGDYAFNKVSQTKVNQDFSISEYEMSLPVKGEYPNIRNFISASLHAQPALALSKLQFKRENTLLSEVEAELVFVIFVKDSVVQ